MHNFVVLFILITDITYGTANRDYEYIKNSDSEKYSWIGLLRVKLGDIESVTGIVLISERIALANANEISRVDNKVIRKLAKATFFVTDFKWNCNVTKYIVHPEYEKATLNTIALVYLEYDHKLKPIKWPEFNIFWQEIYFVGITDHHYLLQRIIYRMVPVDIYKCREFYKKEGLDFKYIWPRHVLCSKGAESRSQCTFEAGMALVANYNETLTLVGLSISGPGCSLPSRYIELLPYIPWIQAHVDKLNLNFTRRSVTTSKDKDVRSIDPSLNIVSDSYSLDDDFYVRKINDSTMVINAAYANIKDYHGDCLNNPGVMMYREAGTIRSKGYNTGVFAVNI